MSPGTSSRLLPLAGLAHVTVTFLLLVVFAEATPWWKDASQLVAAYGTGGLPHPTGFPFLATLGRLACLLPLGTLAFRVTLLSAAAAALTSGILFLTSSWLALRLREPGTGPGPLLVLAWGAAWGFLAARTVWFHALAAEVYLPSAALSAACIGLTLRALLDGRVELRRGTLRVLALLAGLASGLHVTALAAGLGSLALLTLAGARDRSARRGAASAAVPLLLFVGGALIQLYLPVRAWGGPWTLFADASDAAGWLGYATGRTIREAFQADIGGGASLATLTDNAAVCGTHLLTQAGPALPAAAVGIVVLARRSWSCGLLVAAAWAGDLVFTVVVNPMGQKDFQTGVLSFFVIFLAATPGLAGLVAYLPQRLRTAASFLAAAALLAIPVLSLQPAHRALGASGLPELYGLALLRPLPPESLVLTTLDDASGLLLHHQLLENRRRDSLALVVQNLPEPGLTAAPRGRYGDTFFPPAPPAGDPRQVASAFIGHSLRRGNPVFWQPGQAAFHPVVQGHLRPGFPLCRVERDPGPEPPLGRWAGVLAEWRTLRDAADGPPDPMGAMVLADGLQLAAALQVEELQAALRVPGPPPPGPAATAEALFTESLWLFDEDCRAWSNFAALKGLLGQTEFALEAATRAAELCPLHGPARANHVRYLFLAGRMEEGLAAASDALALPVRGDLVPRLRRLVGDLDAGGRGDAARTLERLLPP